MAKKPKKTQAPSLCDRLRDSAEKLAKEAGYEIVDVRCSVMGYMFVPGGKPKKRAAFSFTIVGADQEKK